jgi:hypothetical protein
MFVAVVIDTVREIDAMTRVFDTFDAAAAYLLAVCEILGTRDYDYEIHPAN